ncbi:MAG: hypothetical protein R2857_14185 [Vampirovibrionales bacterium]|nr:hypothetical protein [Cyanobacteria bacterium HKST-UBA05]MCA9842102.1 hypothetical protein [Cyanobacteria bacterium HKST-UBA03]
MNTDFEPTLDGRQVGAIRQSTAFNPGGAVFSSRFAFNPTTLAVQTSLEEELFNEGMQHRIVEGLRVTNLDDLT